MANYLGYDFVDSAEVIIFNEDGSFDADTTDKLLGERLSKLENAVDTGFYGATLGGVSKNFLKRRFGHYRFTCIKGSSCDSI